MGEQENIEKYQRRHPTPKLTAEERARSCVVSDEVVSHPMNIDDVIHQIDEASNQAFKQVLAIVPGDADWDFSRDEFLARLRALAKEPSSHA